MLNGVKHLSIGISPTVLSGIINVLLSLKVLMSSLRSVVFVHSNDARLEASADRSFAIAQDDKVGRKMLFKKLVMLNEVKHLSIGIGDCSIGDY